MNPSNPLPQGPSVEARAYAVAELARRAGVSERDFHTWRIEVGTDATVVHPAPGGAATIRFPHHPPEYWAELDRKPLQAARLEWIAEPPDAVRRLVPEFRVPFAPPTVPSGRPLFAPIEPSTMECAVDLPAAAFCTLSRVEEDLCPARDEHGRFPSRESVGCREGFAHRPIVDEMGLGLEQALRSLLPGWRPEARTLRCKISHDIDWIGIPFRWQATLGHTLLRRKPGDTLRDLTGAWLGREPAWLRCVRDVTVEVRRRGLSSAVYWKSPPSTEWDTGYDPRSRLVQKVVADLRTQGVELGVHPGYFTFHEPARLRQEVAVVREAVGAESIGGRQHYLRWSPRTWRDWEECGLAYDSTVGYPDQVGFRAGTCHPYRPWLLDLNRAARLTEIPLIVMDGTLTECYGTRDDEIRRVAEDLVQRCRLVGGVFTLLWHNSLYNHPVYWRVCTRILDLLSGVPEYKSGPAPLY